MKKIITAIILVGLLTTSFPLAISDDGTYETQDWTDPADRWEPDPPFDEELLHTSRYIHFRASDLQSEPHTQDIDDLDISPGGSFHSALYLSDSSMPRPSCISQWYYYNSISKNLTHINFAGSTTGVGGAQVTFKFGPYGHGDEEVISSFYVSSSSLNGGTHTFDPPLELVVSRVYGAYDVYIYIDLSGNLTYTGSFEFYGWTLPQCNATIYRDTVETNYMAWDGTIFSDIAFLDTPFYVPYSVSASAFNYITDPINGTDFFNEFLPSSYESFFGKINWGDGYINNRSKSYMQSQVSRMGSSPCYPNPVFFWRPCETGGGTSSWVEMRDFPGYPLNTLINETNHNWHTYTETGEYKIELQTSLDNNFYFDYDTFNISVVDTPPTVPQISYPGIWPAQQFVTFTFESSDFENDWISYIVDWGDGDVDYIAPLPSGVAAVEQHYYYDEGIYLINVTAQDSSPSTYFGNITPVLDQNRNYGAIRIGTDTPPDIPPPAEGPSVLGVLDGGIYEVVATDPDNDSVYVSFNWGDGYENIFETDLQASGSVFTADEHSWSEPGTYYISCKVTDEYGASSRWQYDYEAKQVIVAEDPTGPSNISLIPFWEAIKLDWDYPLDDGGAPVIAYDVKYWCEEIQNSILIPTADGHVTDWATTNLVNYTHFSEVDDFYPDGDITKVYTSFDSMEDYFDISIWAPLFGGKLVHNITVHALAKTDVDDTLALMIYDNSENATVEHTGLALGTSYGEVNYTFENNPSGGSWSYSDLSNLEIGIKSEGSTGIDVTQVWVSIVYQDDPAWADVNRTSNTYYWLNGVENDVNYTFQVRSVSETSDASPWSENITGSAGHTPPQWTDNALQSLPTYSQDSVQLSWSSATLYDGASLDTYKVYQSTDGSSYTNVKNTTATTTVISGLDDTQIYYWKLKCVDDYPETSEFSNTAVTTIDATRPSRPIMETPITVGSTANLNWTESFDDGSGLSHYVLQYADNSYFNDAFTETLEEREFQITIEGYAKTWYFRVKGVDNVGLESSWSNSVFSSSLSITGDEYTQFSEIWFSTQDLQINHPTEIRVAVDPKYDIETLKYEFNGEEFEMEPAGTTNLGAIFSAPFTPDSSGDEEIEFYIINEKNSASSLEVPLTILESTPDEESDPRVTLLENEDQDYVTPVIFSTDALDISSYKDEFNQYHVTFGNEPRAKVKVDLSYIEPQLIEGKWWIFDIDWLDSYKIKCVTHGTNYPVIYKINKETGKDAIIDGFNNWFSKWFGWLTGKDFELVTEDVNFMELITKENNMLDVKFK